MRKLRIAGVVGQTPMGQPLYDLNHTNGRDVGGGFTVLKVASTLSGYEVQLKRTQDGVTISLFKTKPITRGSGNMLWALYGPDGQEEKRWSDSGRGQIEGQISRYLKKAYDLDYSKFPMVGKGTNESGSTVLGIIR